MLYAKYETFDHHYLISYFSEDMYCFLCENLVFLSKVGVRNA